MWSKRISTEVVLRDSEVDNQKIKDEEDERKVPLLQSFKLDIERMSLTTSRLDIDNECELIGRT